MLTSDPAPQTDLPFLMKEHSIRISVSGLAFCKLDWDNSVIHFLRHIQFHELKMEIVQIEVDSEGKAISRFNIGKFNIGADHDITIEPDNSEKPKSLALNVGARTENDLSRIINFNNPDLHGDVLDPIELVPSIERPTTLIFPNGAFYTRKSTEEEYELIVALPLKEDEDPMPIVPVPAGYVGLELGGAIECRWDAGKKNVTRVKVTGDRPLELALPQKIGDVNFIYEIIFNNHCIQTDDRCKNLAGDDSDFRFYYDILQDKNVLGKTFKMRLVTPEPVTSKKGKKPAVCNIVRNGS